MNRLGQIFSQWKRSCCGPIWELYLIERIQSAPMVITWPSIYKKINREFIRIIIIPRWNLLLQGDVEVIKGQCTFTGRGGQGYVVERSRWMGKIPLSLATLHAAHRRVSTIIHCICSLIQMSCRPNSIQDFYPYWTTCCIYVWVNYTCMVWFAWRARKTMVSFFIIIPIHHGNTTTLWNRFFYTRINRLGTLLCSVKEGSLLIILIDSLNNV